MSLAMATKRRGQGKVHYGLSVPNFGESSYARTLAELAVIAEESEWDGFFLWDHISMSSRMRRPLPMVDSFTALSAIAANTKHIRIGTAVTPLARRRPWVVARQSASLDHLSGGRLILGVGLGNPPDTEFERFGESSNSKIRAEKLDEGLDILVGLWSGKAFSYQGRHYQIQETIFLPPSKQLPRIPIWVGGFWPNQSPFRRAARWDGVIPAKMGSPVTPKDLRDILAIVRNQRTSRAPFDAAVIHRGTKTCDSKNIQPYVDAGLTWWLESMYRWCNSPRHMRARIREGPPRIS
jgi:alkanesulfonate monooxygenase SsuD/methylene tetrahydromethanopterin reductase-like flavin-dependent oxidoreductase (luciferase family)